jgi:delta24-sterol reductase
MSTRVSTFKKDCEQIELNLHDILSVDVQRQVVRVEPYVNMGQITDHLNRIGWTLALTIEMEDLTVGGLLMGMGLENNSHRYGLFHEICSAYEIVTANGELVRATANQNYDLFRALPGSHGTLGLLVAAELAIVRCKPWVRVDYIPCHSKDELETRLFDLTHDAESSPDFVEATVYSREQSVIFTADYCEAPTWLQWWNVNRFNLWYKPWFYKHVESHLTCGRRTEFVPTRHWFHRHTRSIFWELEDLVPFGNRWWYRWTWAALGPPKVSLLKAFWTPEVRHDLIYKHVVQDILVPFEHLKKTIDMFDETFEICKQTHLPLLQSLLTSF